MILLDAFSLAYRSYFALQKAELRSPDGRESGVVYGFLQTILSLKKTFSSHDIVAVFDGKKPSFRKEIYPEYKSNRQKMPEALSEQIESLATGLPKFGCPVLRMEDFEADDIIASLVNAYSSREEILIVTRDKDIAQLVRKGVSLIYPDKYGKWDLIDEKRVKVKFGVEPSKIKDYLLLTGDSSDNIPGVPGVGPKTAVKLLQESGGIDNLIENPSKYASARITRSIEQSSATIEKAKQLIELRQDLKVPSIEELKVKLQEKEAADYLVEWGMRKIAAEFGFKNKKEEILSTEKLHSEYISGYIGVSILEGRIYASDGRACRIILPEELMNYEDSIVSDDIKELAQVSDVMPQKFEDAGTASYLLDPESGPFSPEALAGKQLKMQLNPEESIRSLPLVWKNLRNSMKDYGVIDLYENIEKPLIPIVYKMEKKGIFVDTPFLRQMSVYYKEELDRIEEKIKEESGGNVNPRSPKQLAFFLYEKLKLPAVSKTKTGYSTDSYALEQIRAFHPVVEMILEHRFISKMLSTYINVIPDLVDDSSRLHCKFDLRSTATGRFASHEPNLQNIPIKNPGAREIRKAFRAPDGKKILSADYSQIELRLAAHLSGDETFLEAFRKGEDIHSRTASELFSGDSDTIGITQRNLAKTVNFGVLYGMSPFKLSKDLNISLAEAKSFIESYFGRFSKIKNWQETLVDKALIEGEVRTFTGRRRLIRGLDSRNFNERERAKRKVFNTPVQGGAADIIKIAMLKVNKAVKSLPVSLVLQIHDELLFEVEEKEVEKTSEIVKNTMENAVELDIPLTVSVSWGENWFETH